MRFFRLSLTNIFCCTCLLFFFLSCIGEDLGGCASQYTLAVRAVDADGKDITESGVLQKTDIYLFDENGFVRMVPVGTSTGFLLGADKNATLTFVAWGNLKTDTLQTTVITPGTSIMDARLLLRRQAKGSDLPVTDLFFCNKTFTSAQIQAMQGNTITLIMTRWVAGISIRTHNFSVRYPYIGQAYHFVVRGTGNKVDFTGKVIVSEASYVPPFTTDSNGDMYASSFRIFPTEEGQYIEIDIYRGDEKLYTVTTDSRFKRLFAPSGRQLNVDIDFLYDDVKVSMTIAPWGKVTQDTEM